MRRKFLTLGILLAPGWILGLQAVGSAAIQDVATAAPLDPQMGRVQSEIRAPITAIRSRPPLTDKPLLVPHEAPGDMPAPPEVLSRRTSSPAAVVTREVYTSVQVNVNAVGDNIVGDAANEPSIAIDPTDPTRIVIGWRQFATIASNFREAGWAYSHDAGQTWTFPGVLEPGQFRSDPVLAADSGGNFFYSSLSSSTSAELFTSTDGGVTWSPPVNAFGGDKQWITVDRTSGIGSGHIYEFWNMLFSCCSPNDFARSIDGGQSFEPPIAIPQPSMMWGTLAVGPDGELYTVGTTIDHASHVVAKSNNAQDSTQTPLFEFVNVVNLGGATVNGGAPNPGGLVGQVWVAVDRSNRWTRGNAYMLASVDPFGPDPLDVHIVSSADGGLTWDAPVRVNDDATDNGAWQWFGTMSVASNGRIDVVWNDTRGSGQANVSQLFYAYSMDTGAAWSTNVALTPAFDSHLGWPNQSKLGDYYHMVSDEGGASLAYAATFNGEQDVYFLRIPQDCNNNGIEDPTDIDDGTSEDCNNNRVPDECEPDEDCNSNAIQDICDVAAGTSEDCNFNDVPDECEPDEDCNGNTVQDVCDIAVGSSEDCNLNFIPDECDISAGTSSDDNSDGVPDECQGACCQCGTCVDTLPIDCITVGWEFSGLGILCASETCPTIGNDDCAAREILPAVLGQVVPVDNRCAAADGPTPVSCDAGSIPVGADVWYEYAPPCDGEMTVSLCQNTNFDTVLAVYGDGGPTCTCPTDESTLEACGDDTCGVGGGPSVVAVPVEGGACYLLRVAGWSSTKGIGELDVQVECDDCYPTTTTDCNENEIPDECDLSYGTSLDCNDNTVPDECDIEVGTSEDCQLDGVPDECQLSSGEGPPPDVGTCSPTADNGEAWCDDFESYPVGSIQGRNGWEGWGGPSYAAVVTTAQNHTPGGAKSLGTFTHDTVRLFSGYDANMSSRWIARGQFFIPYSMTGASGLVFFTDYEGGGPNRRWSVVLFFDADARVVRENGTGATLPLLRDRWVEVVVLIDLAEDVATVLYDGQLLVTRPWTLDGGTLKIEAIGPFAASSANGSYCDDMSLYPVDSFSINDLDCNENDIPDECDIDPSDPDGNGQVSLEANGNLVPDDQRTSWPCGWL
ncbi:MAG: sialidase family protein [Planctomycetota bacterium]|jgi:hypothetical protein